MMIEKVYINADSTIPRLSFPRVKPQVTISVTIHRLKSGVTRSAMPTALEVAEHVVSASAIGTTHFVTAEFIPMSYSADIETTSAIGTADLVTWEFIPVLFVAMPYLKTNKQWKM